MLPYLRPTLYKTCRVGNYFNLKCNTAMLSLSNVVYHFSCPCDTGLTYIGKSTHHVVTIAKEHLNLGSLIERKKNNILLNAIYVIKKTQIA